MHAQRHNKLLQLIINEGNWFILFLTRHTAGLLCYKQRNYVSARLIIYAMKIKALCITSQICQNEQMYDIGYYKTIKR